MADLGLATNTAGSGRVPAAFQGLIGVKPTRGLVSTRGVVPACRSFACVSVLARTMAVADAALAAIAAPDPWDPGVRTWPANAPQAAPRSPRVAIAGPRALAHLSAGFSRALHATIADLQATSCSVVEIDVEPLLAAGDLLYGGAFVAERYAAFGAFLAAHPKDADPAVAEIVLGARSISADRYAVGLERLREYRLAAGELLRGFDALLLPTAPYQPALAQVAADPIELNRQLGTYTAFCNLLDHCAVAVPAGTAGEVHFGVTLFAPAFHDRVIPDLAALITGEERATPGGPSPSGATFSPPAIELLVVGAHLLGEPLNHQLTDRGGSLIAPARTADGYRLYRLATTPPKPGLVRRPPRLEDAVRPASVEGELWALPPAGLASLLAELTSPMALGKVTLKDGSEVVGFLCEPAAVREAEDITSFGGWRSYLAHERA
jgi:allophanate hydrolase